jgi:large subunit ribosomal protein L13
MKTYAPKPQDVERRWYVVDANGVVLGRLASEVAQILKGKHKPIYAPHADVGDHVIVVNAKGVRLTGGKENKKVAYRHSGYPGGLTETPYARLLERRPRFVVEKAVKGMLTKNRLGRAMASKLQVYEGAEHPHQAQKPVPLALGERPTWPGLPVRAPKPAPEPKTRPARPPAEAATAKKSAARKAPARKAPARKAPARKAPARKAEAAPATRKSTAKRATTRKAAASEAPAPEADTAKAPAKKSSTRRSRRKKSEE